MGQKIKTETIHEMEDRVIEYLTKINPARSLEETAISVLYIPSLACTTRCLNIRATTKVLKLKNSN